jgi:hypothetical protein
MKKLTTLFAIMISFAAFGQEKSEKLYIGASFSPDISYRTLRNDESYMSPSITDARNEIERPKFSQTAGVLFGYKITSGWSIESGFLYSNKGYKAVFSNLSLGDPIEPRRGFVYTSGPAITKSKMTDNFNYLDIPLRLVFSIGKGNTRFIYGAGVIANILLNANTISVITYSDGQTVRNKENEPYFKRFNFSPVISIGIEQQLNDNFTLRAEPTFRYGLLKIIEAPVTAHLWSGGLNFTCYYNLK